MNLLETLLQLSGRSSVPYFARETFGFKGTVVRSGELRRIEALPRRVWDEEPLISDLVKITTENLRKPSGGMRLWKVQAAAIAEAVVYRGVFCPVGVGQGKALISLLVPVAMEARRPVLFVPAHLRDQTLRFVIPAMAEHWKLHPGLRVLSYSELSQEKNADFLWEYRPDLIILDECHEVKNRRSGRGRRLYRWFSEFPGCECVAMSGTVTTRSIKDFAHIASWCLKGRTPVPLSWQELSEWADALDEKIPEGQRVKPGALRRFCNKEESARQGFRRRLTETPGVVATSEEVLGTSLRVLEWKTDHKPSEKLLAAIDKVRKTWETPNGDIITEAVDMWRHMRELALGFWYRWNPPAPRDWLEARRAWKSHVREVLRHNRRRLDTELQVWNECERSESPPRVWTDWKEIRDEFRPNTVAEWIDDHAIRNCLRWLVHNDGICWVEHRAFGEQLAQVARVPYFGAGDDRILDTEETAIVASIRAHSQGKNLERWSRNLVPCPMTSGKEWEQLLGRTHRPGQEADEVICEVGLDWPELAASFEQARADALYIEDTIGQRQKLNYADLVITDTKEPRSGSGFSHSAREGGKEG